MSIVNKRLNRFKHQINNNNIQELFNIPEKTDNESIKIDIGEIDKSRITLHINYEYKYNSFFFDNLPPEINNIIDSFLVENLKLEFQIKFPFDYPFNNTLWFLTNLESNSYNKKNLISHYVFKVNNHNIINKKHWNAAILIDKDILFFVSNILDFKNVLLS